MSQFYSGADLKRGVLQRCGEPTDGTSEYDSVALKYINQIYFGIISGSNEFDIDCGEVWNWALSSSPIILTLKQAYGEDNGGGLVNVTNGSTSGSFTLAPTDSLKYQYLFVDDSNPEKYRIVSHNAGETNFTLDGPYNGATKSGANFRVLRLAYRLGTENDILRLVEPFRVYKMSFDEDRNYQVYGIDRNSFHMHYSMGSIVSGVPNRFFIEKMSDGALYAQFNMWMSEDIRCEVDFIPPPAEITDSDQSTPLIPRAFRICLEYGGAALLMLDKNDDRASSYTALAKAKIQALVEATRKEQSHINSKSKGMLFPRQEFLRVRQRLQSFNRVEN